MYLVWQQYDIILFLLCPFTSNFLVIVFRLSADCYPLLQTFSSLPARFATLCFILARRHQPNRMRGHVSLIPMGGYEVHRHAKYASKAPPYRLDLRLVLGEDAFGFMAPAISTTVNPNCHRAEIVMICGAREAPSITTSPALGWWRAGIERADEDGMRPRRDTA